MSKTFNFYCDESCHLANDGMSHMVIAYVSSAYPQVKLHTNQINELRKKHKVFHEVKWSKVSHSKIEFYLDLVDYFFSTDLQFRAIVIDKSQIRHDEVRDNYDDFYYKMYYQLIHHKINMEHRYNVYLDIKDTLSAKKVNKLKSILNLNYGCIRNLQNIRSHESQLLQLTDLLMGAITYSLRGLERVKSKMRIIDKIQAHCPIVLGKSTPLRDDKFNLFFIELK